MHIEVIPVIWVEQELSKNRFLSKKLKYQKAR